MAQRYQGTDTVPLTQPVINAYLAQFGGNEAAAAQWAGVPMPTFLKLRQNIYVRPEQLELLSRAIRRKKITEEHYMPTKEQATKQCHRCKQDKPLDQFRRKSSRPDGYDYYCKSCADSWGKAKAVEDQPEITYQGQPVKLLEPEEVDTLLAEPEEVDTLLAEPEEAHPELRLALAQAEVSVWSQRVMEQGREARIQLEMAQQEIAELKQMLEMAIEETERSDVRRLEEENAQLRSERDRLREQVRQLLARSRP